MLRPAAPKLRLTARVAGKRSLILVNLLGGIAVLGSYAVCLGTNPQTRGLLWGGVPSTLQPAYTVSMLTATAGYFLFTYYVLFRLDAVVTRVGPSLGYGLFAWIYAGILAPSALWMPLTFRMFESPGEGLWLAIRLVLASVGLCSLLLIAAIAAATPRESSPARAAALLGAVAFAVQTALLDAVVWPYYFPVSSPG